MKPSFSVIIPIADNAPAQKLNTCFHALKKQESPAKEVIVIIGKKAQPSLFQALTSHPQVKIYQKNLSKSAARNYGSQKATGTYLVHLDVNIYLRKKALKKVADLIKSQKAAAVLLRTKIHLRSYLSRIYALEDQLAQNVNPYTGYPLVKREIFQKIGGYDEEIDLLDEFTLKARLLQAGVEMIMSQPLATEEIDKQIFQIIKDKYARGQFLPLFEEKYPGEIRKIVNKGQLASWYPKIFKTLFTQPLEAIGLLILKPLEWTALFLGSLKPQFNNLYQDEKKAQTYDQKRTQTNYQGYKCFSEKQALMILLQPRPKTILEIGAGTGRITQYLVKMGIKVLATEPSEAMLKEYRRKKNLPKPIQSSAEDLDPKLGKKDAVIGIRVLWHIGSPQKHLLIFKKASRLAKKYFIADFVNAGRFKNPFFFPLIWLYTIIFDPAFSRQAYFFRKDEISQLAKKTKFKVAERLPLDLLTPVWLDWLPAKTAQKLYPPLFNLEQKLAQFVPPGRWLIKFTKVTRL